MWIGVGNNLPVHPRNPCLANTIRVLLDIRISSRSGKRCSLGTIVVGGVEVAHSPFLHDELFPCVLGFRDVGLEGFFS